MVLSNSFLQFHKPLHSIHRGLNHLHTKSIANSLSPAHINAPNITEAIHRLELSSSVAHFDTYIKVLEACTRSKSLAEGKKIHQLIIRNNTDIKNTALLEKLICMYITCSDIDQARLLFDKIPQPSVFLWNAMIRAYSWNGPFDVAIDLYHCMINSRITPNKFTFPFVLKACSGILALEEGIEIHNHVTSLGLVTDLYISTALIDMYMKCARLDIARQVFEDMPKRDTVSWNAMIAGYSLHGMYDDTIIFILQMQRMGNRLNSSSVVAVLPVVGQAKALRQGKSIHGFCLRCFEKADVFVATALLDMYAKCESLDYASRIFTGMSTKNEVTWSAMIGGYVQCDRMVDALRLFDQMMVEGSLNLAPTSLACILRACARLSHLSRGKRLHGYLVRSGFLSDLTVGNSLLSLYAKVGSIAEAVLLFDEMETKDTISYSAIISGCVQSGNAKEALVIFKKMQLCGIDPDTATMVGVIPACSHLAALQHGKCNHGAVAVRGFASDISICNALIDMYAKCGRIEHAREVFDRMSKRDIVSFNAMIAGYGIHGLGEEAITLFFTMEATGLEPDDVTFICLISACSHSGLITEGKHWFHAMAQRYKMVPRMEHYICMVDLLGRGGLLDEARDFTLSMPFEPDVRVWGALLGACRIHENIELGEEVSRMIQRLGPEGTGNFVLLSNIYSAAGMFDEAAQIRILQKDKGFKKSPGCSWVEIKGVVHGFIGGDQSHPELVSIYRKLEGLLVDIKQLGYRADTSFALQDVEEEEKELALLYHSEKLAIAFAVTCLSQDQPILITKNLRVCGDCHSAIKFITLATGRAITVRDASRFHHFKDGVCNCRDFW